MRDSTPLVVEETPWKCTFDKKMGKRKNLSKLARLLGCTYQHLALFLNGERESSSLEKRIRATHPEALRFPYCQRKKKLVK
jgi:hypothetical protein